LGQVVPQVFQWLFLRLHFQQFGELGILMFDFLFQQMSFPLQLLECKFLPTDILREVAVRAWLECTADHDGFLRNLQEVLALAR
jgi:hypothetical protein